MLTDVDRAQMRIDLIEIRQDNQVSISIKRGGQTLAPQSVRIARLNSGSIKDSEGGQQATGGVIVLGNTDLNIQVEDRFTVAGVVYQVTFVRPNKTVATTADAMAIM